MKIQAIYKTIVKNRRRKNNGIRIQNVLSFSLKYIKCVTIIRFTIYSKEKQLGTLL